MQILYALVSQRDMIIGILVDMYMPKKRENMKKIYYIQIVLMAFMVTPMSFGATASLTINETKQLVASESQLFSQYNDISQIDSLENYIAFALSNNQQLKSHYYKWAASVENIMVESSLADPQFSAGYFVENVETRVGPQNRKFSLKQQFPWFGTLGSKKRAAFEKSNMLYQSYSNYKQSLIYEVSRSYYLYWLLKQQIQITNENFLLLELWESIARTKYKTAQTSHPDLIKIQIELAKLEEKITELEHSIIPTEIHLRTVLNLPMHVSLFTTDAVNIDKTNLDEVEIRKLFENNNPNLLKTIHAIKHDKAIKQLASRSSRPNFSVGVDYIEIGEAATSSVLESGKDAWGVSASISIPLWFSKNKSKKNSVHLALQSSRSAYEQKKLELQDKLSQIVFTYNDAYRKIKLYRDGLIPKAEQSINVSLKGYQAGDLNILTLLESQRDLLEFQYKLDESKVKFALQKAALNRLTTVNKF